MMKNFYSHPLKRLESIMLLFFVIFAITGCQIFKKKTPEASLDAQLSKTAPPSASIPMTDGEPQKGFKQEPAGTRNS